MIWFTADTHFGHANIIKHCKRPFKDVEQMNQQMVNNWNRRVRSTDIVYHLGDFAMGRNLNFFLEQLNGDIHLIIGNHDDRRTVNRTKGFVSVRDTDLIKIDGTMVWLSHYAHRTWPHQHHGAYHLFGHSHGNLLPFGKSCDVGVDCWDFMPVSFTEIRQKLDSPQPAGSLEGALAKHANRTHR